VDCQPIRSHGFHVRHGGVDGAEAASVAPWAFGGAAATAITAAAVTYEGFHIDGLNVGEDEFLRARPGGMQGVPMPYSAEEQADRANPARAWWRRTMPTALGGDPTAVSPGQTAAALAMHRQLTGLGWTTDQAAGIISNVQRESAFNPNGTGDNGQAYGIAQLHPDRQAEFRAWSGHDIHGSTREEQTDFINYELTAGKERAAGTAARFGGRIHCPVPGGVVRGVSVVQGSGVWVH